MPLKEILSSFMEAKTPRSRVKGNTDDEELAIVKAAAWAWYQHGGSGSERKPEDEFDITRRINRVSNYKPSRYKLEAMKIAQKDDILEAATQTTDNNNSLLDSYEIESISNELDRLVECTENKLYHDHERKNLSSKGTGSSGMLKKKTQKVIRSFWARHGVVCGTRQDVVNPRRVPRFSHS